MQLQNGSNFKLRNNAGLHVGIVAAYSGSVEVLRVLFDFCKQQYSQSMDNFLNSSDNEGNIVLHAAVDSGNLEAVQFCMDCNARIDVQQNDKSSPVHFAALRGELQIIQAMFQAQPERVASTLRLTDINGMTALHKAVIFDNVAVVQYLLDQGAKIDAPDNNDQTPLLVAASKGSKGCIMCLFQRGANVQYLDKDGRNFVHLAVLSGCNFGVLFGESDAPEVRFSEF